VLEMTKEGVFTAPKRKRTGGGIGGKKRKKRAVSVAKERTARDNEVALVGAEFEDEGTMWKGVAVDWSDDDNCIAVWYYDLDSAATAGISEDDLLVAKEEGKTDDIDIPEFSSVAEVRRWVALSKKE